jgi:hypothetical protein
MPLAALAVVSPANEIVAQAIAAPDCDGPLQVLMSTVPAVLIYGAGALLPIGPAGAFIASLPLSA